MLKCRFIPKPDSACKYIQNNNGPDGVAIFYKKSKFQSLGEDHKVLEAWGAATNQVALAMTLVEKASGREVVVAWGVPTLHRPHGKLAFPLTIKWGIRG